MKTTLKNYKLLKEIALRRQCGYTTALSQINNGKILVHKKAMKDAVKRMNKKASCITPAEFNGITEPIIPDNCFLWLAVNEIETYVKTLKAEIKKLKARS